MRRHDVFEKAFLCERTGVVGRNDGEQLEDGRHEVDALSAGAWGWGLGLGLGLGLGFRVWVRV